jgi:hypothetical protein
MKHNYFTEVSLQFDIIPQNLHRLVSYWQGFTITIVEIRALNSSCCRTGERCCKCYVTGPKIIVQWARPAPYVGFSLHFQTAATPYVCCTVLKDHTSWQTLIPLSANNLMQSAQHVTTYVHIHFWISKYEYNADDSCSTEHRCHGLQAY